MRLGGLLVAFAVLVTACGGAEASPTAYRPVETEPMVIVTFPKVSRSPFVAPTIATGTTVSLIGSVFDPTPLRVPLGSTVIWTNRDAIAHTVTSGVPGAPDGAWDGQLGGAGATFTWTFSTAGSFAYYCRFHAGLMHGVIEVR